MGVYSEELEKAGYEIYPDDEKYREKLAAVMKTFRRFDEALDAFLAEKGYPAAGLDLEGKVKFIRERFRKSGISAPRNIRSWYAEHKRVGRRTAILLCFALGLDYEESEDFLRRVCLERGLDCHEQEEAVWYFCLKNRIPYREARELQERIPRAAQTEIDFAGEVYYTAAIRRELDQIRDPEELVRYLTENKKQFFYHNATAYGHIRDLWREISGPGGLAEKEGKLAYRPENTEKREKKNGLSIWVVYLQILGLSEELDFQAEADRSLKPFIENNQLLHPLAESSFPDRDGLNKILNGVPVSNERVRKWLILLAFYKYWACRAVWRPGYHAEKNDGERCMAKLNHYLSDAGYPALYEGNPFDWLILYLSIDDYPLLALRDYMRELTYAKRTADDSEKSNHAF